MLGSAVACWRWELVEAVMEGIELEALYSPPTSGNIRNITLKEASFQCTFYTTGVLFGHFHEMSKRE